MASVMVQIIHILCMHKYIFLCFFRARKSDWIGIENIEPVFMNILSMNEQNKTHIFKGPGQATLFPLLMWHYSYSDFK